MKLSNGTNEELYYDIRTGSMADCGKLVPQGSTDLPAYDNKSDVTVSMLPTDGKSIELNVPQTGEGKTVTLAMFFS